MSSDDASDVGRSVNVYANLGGSGTLNSTGNGSLILGGSNNYSGGTNIHAGTLEASTTGSLPNYNTTGKISVAGGATLAIAVGGTEQWNSGASENLGRACRQQRRLQSRQLAGNRPSGGNFTRAYRGQYGPDQTRPKYAHAEGAAYLLRPHARQRRFAAAGQRRQHGNFCDHRRRRSNLRRHPERKRHAEFDRRQSLAQSGANFTMIDGSIGSLQVRGSAVFNGGTLNFDIGGGSADLLTISGNAAALETVSLNVSTTPSLTGIYTLITAGGGQATLNGAHLVLRAVKSWPAASPCPATLNASSGTALTLTVGAGGSQPAFVARRSPSIKTAAGAGSRIPALLSPMAN